MTSTPASLFVPEGDAWLPTDLCRGPWDRGACHGGAPAALVTRALESVPLPETPGPTDSHGYDRSDDSDDSDDSGRIAMRLARVTIELVRPVPTRPLRIETSVLRPGRKVSLVEATMSTADDDVVVLMARALRIRTTEPGAVTMDDVGPGGAGSNELESVPPPLPPEPTDVSTAMAGYLGFHNGGTEHRFVRGSFHEPGPVFDWIRLAVPVVPTETPSPWQRAAAAADFANGIASSVGFGTGLFINPDLTVHLWREPVGEWVGMESVMRTSPTGIGVSDSAMWDEAGRIGRTNQSLLLDSL